MEFFMGAFMVVFCLGLLIGSYKFESAFGVIMSLVFFWIFMSLELQGHI